MSNSKEVAKLKEKSTRVKRKRLDVAGPLYVDPQQLEQGYVYRIVADRPGNIARRQHMGYEIVENKNIEVGDNAEKTSRLGSAVVIETGRKKEEKSVLMRIRVEDYEEIVAEKNEEADAREEAIFADLNGEGKFYGGLKKE